MALKPCRECKKKVSTEATVCPSCGVPNPTQKKTTVKPWGAERKTVEPTSSYKFGKVEIDNDNKSKTNYTTKTNDSSQTNNNSTSKETGFGAFVDGDLDLTVSFWLYGIVGSIIIGVVTGYLSGTYDPTWGVLYVIAVIIILIGVWRSANKYTKVKISQNKSSIWGGMAKAFCIVSALGLLKFLVDLVALLEK